MSGIRLQVQLNTCRPPIVSLCKGLVIYKPPYKDKVKKINNNNSTEAYYYWGMALSSDPCRVT